MTSAPKPSPWVMIMDRGTIRRRSIPAFIRTLAERHPELRQPVGYVEFLAIAARESVPVRLLPLDCPARLLRVGQNVCIQLDEDLSRGERAIKGMHELCHFWRDDPGQPCYYSDDESTHPNEDFADIFAWAVTSPARVFVPGLREKDL